MTEIKLGLGSIPRTFYLFVENGQGCGWYTLEDDKQKFIQAECLTGTITKIEFNKEVKTTMGDAYKTDIHVKSDRNYVIRCGSSTYFNKSLLLSLNALTSEQLKAPIAIAVKPGDKTVVFCEVYTVPDYQKVAFKWDGHKEIDMHQLESSILQKLGGGSRSGQIPPVKSYTPNDNPLAAYAPAARAAIPEGNATSGIDRNMMIEETTSLMSRKGIDQDKGRGLVKSWYGKVSRHVMTDEELIDFRDRLSRWQPQPVS